MAKQGQKDKAPFTPTNPRRDGRNSTMPHSARIKRRNSRTDETQQYYSTRSATHEQAPLCKPRISGRCPRFGGKSNVARQCESLPDSSWGIGYELHHDVDCGSGDDRGRGGCKRGNSTQLCCHTHKPTANDYPEVGSTPRRRSAEDHAMTT
jgi:hypothetical protein